jgi:hypothetical protein
MMKRTALSALLALCTVTAFAQNEVAPQPYEYKFTVVKEHAATPVKDQAKT